MKKSKRISNRKFAITSDTIRVLSTSLSDSSLKHVVGGSGDLDCRMSNDPQRPCTSN